MSVICNGHSNIRCLLYSGDNWLYLTGCDWSSLFYCIDLYDTLYLRHVLTMCILCCGVKRSIAYLPGWKTPEADEIW
jgi:hypothetical protein